MEQRDDDSVELANYFNKCLRLVVNEGLKAIPLSVRNQQANGEHLFKIEIMKDREDWWYDKMVGEKFNTRQATYDDLREASVIRYDAKDCYAVIDDEFNKYIVLKSDSRLSV